MPLCREYETQILCMLIASEFDMQSVILNLLSKNMFFSTLHQRIFETCETLFKKNIELNVFSISEILENNVIELFELQKNYITNVNYKYYIKKIHENYFNSLIKNAESIEDMETIQDERDKYTDKSILQSISNNAINLLEEQYVNQKSIKTGYSSIDEKLGCLQGGDLLILAGATGMGKTCMIINLMASMAKQGLMIDFYSLEMSVTQVQNRLICSQTTIDASHFRTQSLKEHEYKLYEKFIREELEKYKINICTSYDDVTVEKMRSLSKKSDSDIIVVDYLGLLNGNESKSNYERIGEISRKLKLTALALNKPIIALHQLNRSVADRQDKTPKLHDLRDSGRIEEDADMVCFVYRPAYYEAESYKDWDLQFIIGKSRHTESNQTVRLCYQQYCQRITEKEQSYAR